MADRVSRISDEPPSPWLRDTLMARLSPKHSEEFLALAPRRLYPAGAVLMGQGDPDSHVCLLRSIGPGVTACAKVTAIADNGYESLLGVRVSGDLVGELAGLRKVPRSAGIVTCTQMWVHVIPYSVFQEFLNSKPDVWRAVSQMIADRLEWSNRRRIESAGFDVPVRLARVMIELADRYGSDTPNGLELGVRLSQADLGRLIGAGEDAVGQAMRKLRAAGLARQVYRGAIITDLAGLRDFAY